MTNAFYNTTGEPTTGAFAASSVMRAQFSLIQAGFDKLPTLTAGAVVGVNQAGTALIALSEITISSAGNVGIGNAAPIADPGFRTLTVGDATTPGEIIIVDELGTVAGAVAYDATSSLFQIGSFSGHDLQISAGFGATSNNILFNTNASSSDQMRLTSTGVLVLGPSTSPLSERPSFARSGTEMLVQLGDSSAPSVLGARSTHIYPAAAPSNPSTGWLIYCDSGDGNKLKARASTGTVVTLGTP